MKSSFLCGFSCCRPGFHFFSKILKILAIFKIFQEKGKAVKLFFRVWPKMENWQFFATVKNRLCATSFLIILVKLAKIFKNFAKNCQKSKIFGMRKGDFSRSRNLPIFQFLAKPEKTALHLCLFSKNFRKITKIFEKSKKVKNRAYNKKIHTKMTILPKLSKNQLFFLKIVLQ